jgi:hypothetical protein
MRLRLLPSHSFRHSRFTLANRITSLSPTIRQVATGSHRDLSENLLGFINRAGIKQTPWLDWFLRCLGVPSKEHKLLSEVCSPKHTFWGPLGTLC